VKSNLKVLEAIKEMDADFQRIYENSLQIDAEMSMTKETIQNKMGSTEKS
jgi:hypothetical protein